MLLAGIALCQEQHVLEDVTVHLVFLHGDAQNRTDNRTSARRAARGARLFRRHKVDELPGIERQLVAVMADRGLQDKRPLASKVRLKLRKGELEDHELQLAVVVLQHALAIGVPRLRLGCLGSCQQPHDGDARSVLHLRAVRNAHRLVLVEQRLVLLERAAEAKEPQRLFLHGAHACGIDWHAGALRFLHGSAEKTAGPFIRDRALACLHGLTAKLRKNMQTVFAQTVKRSSLDEALDRLAVHLGAAGTPLEVLERRIWPVGPLVHDFIDSLGAQVLDGQQAKADALRTIRLLFDGE